MFLDKYFKKKKDKGSLYGAICATQSLVQLNICIASQQATLWFVQAAQGEALAFRSKPRRHPWFSPGRGSWEESTAESPRFLGLAPPGMLLCSNLSLQHAESKIYPSVPAHLWFNRCALVWGPVQHWSAARQGERAVLETTQLLSWPCRHKPRGLHHPHRSNKWGMKSTQVRKSRLLSHTSLLALTSPLNNSDVLALPDKNWSFKLKCHLLVKKLGYVFHSWERTHLCL